MKMIIMNSKRKNSVLSVAFLTLTVCLLYAVSAGIRCNYGIMLAAISEHTGIAYASVSFVIAVGQLVFGIAQPVFGIIALKKSNRFVLAFGIILMALGMFLIPFSKTFWMLLVSLGVILPTGTGAVSFGIIMGAVTPKLGEKKAATVSGLVNAASGIGSSALSPMIRGLLLAYGLTKTTMILCIPILILLPFSLLLGANTSVVAQDNKSEEESISQLYKTALHNKTFLLLMAGFFTCGFHMAIIEIHLYSQIISYNLSDSTAAFAISVYGITIMVGSIISGVLCSRIPMKNILVSLYGFRALFVAVFLLVPKTSISVYCFTIVLGLTGSATVSPTAGLVSKTFGSKKLGTLFGFVFFCHQIGSFFSAWLGGVCVKFTGGYILIWAVDIALCALASVVSFNIREVNEDEQIPIYKVQ